jgi:hypothetical protein
MTTASPAVTRASNARPTVAWPLGVSCQRHHHHTSRRGGPSGLRRRPDGSRSTQWPVPAHTHVCAHSRLQPESRTPAHLPIQYTDLSRTARAGLPPPGWRPAHRGPRQPRRGRAQARYLRPGAQSAIPRSARPLWCSRAALPCSGLRFESLADAQTASTDGSRTGPTPGGACGEGNNQGGRSCLSAARLAARMREPEI